MNIQDIYKIQDESEQVQAIYRLFHEETRLNYSQAARVEFYTNVRYIERYLKPGMRILDVGAGAGEYSLYFARKGFDVSAIELAESNVEAFRRKIQPQDQVDLVQGNALDLSRYPDGFFDIVLVFGPLYHLHKVADQEKCMREAKRVCKPEGKLFFAFISNDFPILTEFKNRPDYFVAGEYDKETFALEDFPFVFHTVEQCSKLMNRSGLRLLHQVASDGVSELLNEKINAMDAENYAQYLRYHFYICEKPEFLGMSNHLLYVAEKEDSPVWLEAIDESNWRYPLQVRPEQQEFVANGATLLARAYAYRQQNSHAFLIRAGETPVGMGLYYDCPEMNAYDLSQFFVDQRYQGRGYGKAAVQLMLDAMKADGRYAKAILCFVEGNDAARKLYAKFGFVETGRDGNEIIMEAEL